MDSTVSGKPAWSGVHKTIREVDDARKATVASVLKISRLGEFEIGVENMASSANKMISSKSVLFPDPMTPF
jgi:hypothetical protein